jgi:hypothetical protein
MDAKTTLNRGGLQGYKNDKHQTEKEEPRPNESKDAKL